MIEQFAIFVYYLCVDFMVNFAAVMGFTYRDANATILFIFIPIVLLTDILLCIAIMILQRNNNTTEIS